MAVACGRQRVGRSPRDGDRWAALAPAYAPLASDSYDKQCTAYRCSTGRPAYRAGIHTGDILVSLNGRATLSQAAFDSVPASLKPRQTVTATVVGQDGKSRAVTLHLGEFAGQRELAVLVHALRRRVAGQRRFVSLRVLVPGEWGVARGHPLCERNAANIVARLPQTTVSTHLEPREDLASFADQGLDSRPVEAGDWEAARDAV